MSASGSAQQDISRARAIGVLAVILLLGAALRWAAIQADGLWMDEIFGASYVNLSLAEIVIAVLRFDIHPPGYYLQLGLWGGVAQGDRWLLLNSILWSLCTVAAVYGGTAARAGRVAGLIAATLTMLLGSELFFSAELRMYSMLSCITVLLWWSVDAWLLRGRHRAVWMVAALMFVLSLLHSAAFLAAGSVLAYAWLCWLRSDLTRPSWKALFALTVWTGAVLLPWLVNASMRSVSHTQVPNLGVVTETLGGWWLGYFPGLDARLFSLGAVVTFALVLLLLRSASGARAVTFSFVLGPVVLVAVVSVLLRPIWLDRTMAYAAVFLPIALALHLAARTRSPRSLMAWGAVLIAVQVGLFFGLAQGMQRLEVPRKMQFREAAQHIARQNAFGQVIYVPSNVRFWAMARYLAGPQWGSLLAVQDPLWPDDSETWQRIYKRLGDDLLARLHLKPRTRVIDSPHGQLWIGPSALPDEVVRAGYFFVSDMRDRDRPQACPQGIEQARTAFVGVMVFQCRQP